MRLSINELIRLFDTWLDYFDIHVATVARQPEAYSRPFHPEADSSLQDPAYRAFLGPTNPQSAIPIVAAGFLVGMFGAMLTYRQMQQAAKLQSTSYLFTQLQKLSPANEARKPTVKAKKGNKPARVAKQAAYAIFAEGYQKLTAITQAESAAQVFSQFPNLTVPQDLIEEYHKLLAAFQAFHSPHLRTLKQRQFRQKFGEADYQQYAATEQADLIANLQAKFAQLKNIIFEIKDNSDLLNPALAAQARLTKLYNSQFPEQPVAFIDLELAYTNGAWIPELVSYAKSPRPKLARLAANERFTAPEIDAVSAPTHANSTFLDQAKAALAFVNRYAMTYWIIWFSAWAIAGAAATAGLLGTALLFGIPAIIPTALLAYQGYKYVQKKFAPAQAKTEADAESPENRPQSQVIPAAKRQIFTKALFADAYYNRVKNEAEENAKLNLRPDLELKFELSAAEKIELYGVDLHTLPESIDFKISNIRTAATTSSPTTATAVKKLTRWPKLRQIMAGAVGMMGGFIATSFASWPLQSLLISLGLAFATGPIFAIAAIVVSTLLGVLMAAYAVRNERRDQASMQSLLAENQPILDELAREANIKQQLTALLKQQTDLIMEKIARDSNLGAEDKLAYQQYFAARFLKIDPEHNQTFWKYLDLQRAQSRSARVLSLIKKAGSRFTVMIASAGTGSLLIRTLFSAGAILGSILAPQVFLALGISSAIVWSAYKVYHYHQNQNRSRAKTLVAEAKARLHALRKENAWLEKQLFQQTAKIQASCLETLKPFSADVQPKASAKSSSSGKLLHRLPVMTAKDKPKTGQGQDSPQPGNTAKAAT